MAVRKRSYLAKSNKGKGGQVFMNNFLVSMNNKKNEKDESRRKQDAYEKKQAARFDKLDKERLKFQRIDERQAISMQRRYEKEQHQEEKRNEKYDKLAKRAELLCDEFDIDHVCIDSIVDEALDAAVSPSALKNTIIKNRLDYWKEKEEELLEEAYSLSIEKVCVELVKSRKIDKIYFEELMQDLVYERIDYDEVEDSKLFKFYLSKSEDRKLILELLRKNSINNYFHSEILEDLELLEEGISFKKKFDVHDLISKYTKKSDLYNLVKENIKEKKILEVFLNDFVNSVLTEDPTLENFYDSRAYKEFLNKTNDKVTDIENRMAVHMTNSIFN